MDKKTFIKQYIAKLQNILDIVDKNEITQIIELLDSLDRTGNVIYFIGNGGSAATVSHMVNDFGTGLRRRGLKNLNVVSLADNMSVITAVGNDIGFENTFYMQIKDIITANDVLFAVSCSGNSPNIIRAVEYAKSIGSTIVGVTGFDGGKLKKLSDISFHVPTQKGEYGLCEDVHMILDHVIYSYYTKDSND